MRRKPAEPVNHDRWLVSYADLITLLFAFFVIMYALSQVDMAKFKKASESIRSAFSGANGASTGQGTGVGAGLDQEGPVDPELRELRRQMEDSAALELGAAELAEKLEMEFDHRGLVVRISAKSFFERNEVVLNPELRPILDRIGKILAKTDRFVQVEGFSDADETKPPGFQSDWELSAARGSWVVRYWVEKFDLDPKRLGVAGYSHFRPVAKEDASEWARARNRRIEIVILSAKPL